MELLPACPLTGRDDRLMLNGSLPRTECITINRSVPDQARAAARRIGPACATSRHVTAHRRQASAHLRIISPLCFPHSAAQASHRSAHKPQTRSANSEPAVRRATQLRHSSRQSLHRRMLSLIMTGSSIGVARFGRDALASGQIGPYLVGSIASTAGLCFRSSRAARDFVDRRSRPAHR
jgi:hypothetical protein